MFLKRIQLSGFKSFADKALVSLDRGITGIVGPNGSGKSNVIDAVRWVMGEQNARTLRGKVATDIIFSGSTKRKALGMAEVSLVFDNSEESTFCPPEYRHEAEISLTRRLYVDGQREYLINKKPCRLKDITNFFAITGLGGKSYSMIQQGQVERILNAKPEDVRVILEEAAGTLIYKIRRDEALKKLINTKENISRIDDIISELDRQHGSLKGQMEKAQKWTDLSNELKDKEVKLFLHDFDRFHKMLTDFSNEISGELETEARLLAEIASLQAEQTELQQNMDEADPDLQILQEQVSSIREDISRAESTIRYSDEKIETARKRISEIDQIILEETENLQMMEKQVETALAELNSAEQNALELQQQIDSFQDEVDAVDEESRTFEGKCDDLEEELKDVDRLLENNSLRAESISRENIKLQSEIEDLEERKRLLEDDLKKTTVEVQEAEAKAGTRQEGLNSYLQRRNELEAAISTRSEILAINAENRDSLKETYLNSRAQYNSLVEIEKQTATVANDVDTLIEMEPHVTEIMKGLVASFVSFNDNAAELSQHAKAAFEKWAEYVIVEDIDALNNLTRLVQKYKLGSIPVSVQSNWREFDTKAVSKWVDKYDAIQLSEYLNISNNDATINALLQRLFYFPDLILSDDVVNTMPDGIIVFTAQGLVIFGQDDFIIGSSHSKGFMTRKNEMEALQTEIKRCESELAAAQAQMDDLEQKQVEDNMALHEIDSTLKNQNQDVLEYLSELQSAKQLFEHKNDVLKSVNTQLNVLLDTRKELMTELEEQGEKRIWLGKEQDRITQELEELREDSGSIQEKKQEVFRQHEQRKRDLAKAEGILTALRTSDNRTREQLDRLQLSISRRYTEKSNLELEIEDIKQATERATNEISVYLSQRETLEHELAEKREENAVILEHSRRIETQLKAANDELRNIQKTCSSKSVEIERIKLVLQNIVDQSMEKYHMDISQVEFEADPDFDAAKNTRDVKRLRSKIEELGSINMMAIEEYNELLKRQDFMSAQRNEILRSILVLEDALEEIEEVSKNKFLETFENVNTEFSELFPILFPGGDARLELTMPDDPLNSGVEILARLPGKKLQRMSLLSGGEKSLTAISLIFALLKTKPTPFCFLDEVDAPLDEANVGRFNRVLQTLSERFQFILITHNRRTMEILDTLFGVTMQEPGVSKIVGVDMKQDIPPHLKKAFSDEKRPVQGATAN